MKRIKLQSGETLLLVREVEREVFDLAKLEYRFLTPEEFHQGTILQPRKKKIVDRELTLEERERVTPNWLTELRERRRSIELEGKKSKARKVKESKDGTLGVITKVKTPTKRKPKFPPMVVMDKLRAMDLKQRNDFLALAGWDWPANAEKEGPK